jgi:L-seryl-tRNA(Ser) seleniumtransferase
MEEELRKLPSVEKVLQRVEIQELIEQQGRHLVVESVRGVIEDIRQDIMSGQPRPSSTALVERVLEDVAARGRPALREVINASGVIVHTNLGRAPLSEEARAAMEMAARGYTNLEYQLDLGHRGSRYVHAEELLCHLTGAGGGLLVNNNAGAVLLVLTTLARAKEVIISRGQLVEIGGGFRIPEVMAQSGARLVEVGTTNRTRVEDYEEAVREETALLMHVHHSNFRMLGFTQQATLSELVDLARNHGLLVVEDLGSGALVDTAPFGLTHEPTVQESVAQGADLVCFSGDKLLGGPQAGIIVGRADLIASLRRHPLTRALRVDKIAIAGIQATLLHYLKQEATEKIPVWRMISLGLEEIQERAEAWTERLKGLGVEAEVMLGLSTVGGGSLPGETLPTKLVALQVPSPDELAHRLRTGEPAVVGRIEEGRFILDPRTVLADEGEELLTALEQVLQG